MYSVIDGGDVNRKNSDCRRMKTGRIAKAATIRSTRRRRADYCRCAACRKRRRTLRGWWESDLGYQFRRLRWFYALASAWGAVFEGRLAIWLWRCMKIEDGKSLLPKSCVNEGADRFGMKHKYWERGSKNAREDSDSLAAKGGDGGSHAKTLKNEGRIIMLAGVWVKEGRWVSSL